MIEYEKRGREKLQRAVLEIARKRINDVFASYGYYSLDEVRLHAEMYTHRCQKTAKKLLEWYFAYDKEVRNYIFEFIISPIECKVNKESFRPTEEYIFKSTAHLL